MIAGQDGPAIGWSEGDLFLDCKTKEGQFGATTNPSVAPLKCCSIALRTIGG